MLTLSIRLKGRETGSNEWWTGVIKDILHLLHLKLNHEMKCIHIIRVDLTDAVHMLTHLTHEVVIDGLRAVYVCT